MIDAQAPVSRYHPGYPPALIRHLEKKLCLTSSSVIADIGCGDGRAIRMFRETGAMRIGLDHSITQFLNAGRGLAATERIHWLQAAAEHLPLRSATCDLVICAEAAQYFKYQLACKEFARILKSHGLLALWWHQWDHTVDTFSDNIFHVCRSLSQHFSVPPEGQPAGVHTSPILVSFPTLIRHYFGDRGACEHESFTFRSSVTKEAFIDYLSYLCLPQTIQEASHIRSHLRQVLRKEKEILTLTFKVHLLTGFPASSA